MSIFLHPADFMVLYRCYYYIIRLNSMFFSFFHRITWAASNIIGKLFLNLKASGRENLKNLDSGGVIFVANHQGRFDPFLIGASIPFSYFLKIKCFRYQTYYKFIIERWYGLFIWLMGAYPVYPKSGPLEKVLAKTVKILKNNQSVLIFPEGKLNQYFDPANAKPGIGYLAKNLNPLIVPVFIKNTHNIKFLEFILRKRRVRITFGQPFRWQDIALPEAEYGEIARRIMGRVGEARLNNIKHGRNMKKFAFVIHPRLIDDFGRRIGSLLGIGDKWGTKILPKKLSEYLLRHLRGRAGFTICSRFNVWDKAEGYIIAVLLTAKQMVELPRDLVEKRIIDTILFAQNKLGAERVGLGAYTTSMTDSGLSVVKDQRIKCAITHGGAFTASSAVSAIRQAAMIKKINIQDSAIAVVGAYGVVGRAAALLASDLRPKKIIITGPKEEKLKLIAQELENVYSGEIVASTENEAIKDSGIVVLCTTAGNSIVMPEILKINAIVVDMAQPHNMTKEVCMARQDVLRIDGGYMSIPNIDLRFEMGPPKEVTFACLTETIISALINDKKNHVGPVDIEFAKYIFEKGNELGFKLAPLTSFSKLIDL